jgi:hypothetical protein
MVLCLIFVGSIVCGRCNEGHDLRLLDYYLVNDYECIKLLHEKVEGWLKSRDANKLNLCIFGVNCSVQ